MQERPLVANGTAGGWMVMMMMVVVMMMVLKAVVMMMMMMIMMMVVKAVVVMVVMVFQVCAAPGSCSALPMLPRGRSVPVRGSRGAAMRFKCR